MLDPSFISTKKALLSELGQEILLYRYPLFFSCCYTCYTTLCPNGRVAYDSGFVKKELVASYTWAVDDLTLQCFILFSIPRGNLGVRLLP